MMEKILRKAAKKCDQAELFFEEAESLLTRSSLDKIEACKYAADHGFGLRVVNKGRIGYAYFKREQEADRAISEAIRSAKLAHKENYSLPGKTRYKKTKSYDKKIASLDENKLVDLLLESMDATSEHAEPLKAEIETEIAHIRVMNTEGVDAETKDTLFTIYCVGKKSESFGDDYYTSKRFANKASEIGSSAGEWAAKGEGGKPLDYKGTIILDQDVIGPFFQTAILRNVNGEFFRRGKSRWKLNQKVTSDFTLVDDPTLDWGVGTTPLDDEGVPTKKKTIIQNGTLKQLYYDTRTANLAKTKSTGNGFRRNHSTQPTIGVTNVIVQPKTQTKLADALYIKSLMGYHNMNPTSGDFSLDITMGLLDEKPIRGCVLTGNFFDILEKCEWSRETKTRDWFTSPKLSFEGKVVGK